MEIGYLGPVGSFSDEAARLYRSQKGEAIDCIPMVSFYDVVEAVENGLVDEGILPIENSTEGAVTQVMDLLFETGIIVIRDELILSVEHQLLGTGTPESVKKIYSHPQAIGQCRKTLKALFPEATLHTAESTSKACEIAKNGGPEIAAIANQIAAETYELGCLKKGLQDNRLNQTRFVVIGRTEREKTGHDKTSIAFSFPSDYPGSLFLVLKAFAEAHINLTRIESRPAKKAVGNYVFYIDFIGHRDEEHVAVILGELRKITARFRVIGSYPTLQEA